MGSSEIITITADVAANPNGVRQNFWWVGFIYLDHRIL
jgi:hypothetical protein